MIRRNILANLIGRAWGFCAVYLFVPFYLRFLGIEAYGLVGFYAALLGVLAFADMGFTATLNREMARLSGSTHAGRAQKELLRTIEIAYGAISVSLSLLIWFLAPAIAERWLRSVILTSDEMTVAIRLMGLAIAFQLPSGLYMGGLMGLQRQVRANSIQIAWSVFQGVGAVLVLWLASPTIIAFAAWQLLSNILYCVAARVSLWHALTPDPTQLRPRFEWEVFRNTWRYAAGMVGISVIGIMLTQADKLVISRMLTLQTLGYYALAVAVASIPITLSNVIASAVFPRLTAHVAMEDRAGLTNVYRKSSDLIAVALIPTGLTLVAFGGEFVFAWTGSSATAQTVAPVAAFLVAGQLLQGITILPYYLGLAHGSVKLSLRLGIASIVVITPLLVYLIAKQGVVGAGVSWLILNICSLPINLYFLHRWFLPRELGRYLRRISVSAVAVLPCVLLAYWLAPQSSSRLLAFLHLAGVWSIAIAASAIAVLGIRVSAKENLLSLLGVARRG